MQSQVAAPQGAGHYLNPYPVYGAPSGFAPLTDEAGVYLPTNPVNSYGDSKMTLEAPKKVEFLVTVGYWMTPAAFFSDYVFPAAGALERPIVHTNYGVTDSILCSARAIQPKFDRHDDFTFWKALSIAGGTDPANWPWETLEDAYYDILKPLGYPVSSYDEFVNTYRMYFPPQRFYKYSAKGFCTPTRKVELYSTILARLGYPAMPAYVGCAENEIDHPELAEEYPIVLTTGGGLHPATLCRGKRSPFLAIPLPLMLPRPVSKRISLVRCGLSRSVHMHA